MKIGLCASENKNNDIDFNISQIEGFIEKTKSEKPDLLLFGESFLQGFDSLCFEYKKDILTALQINSEPIAKIRSIARKEKNGNRFRLYRKRPWGYFQLLHDSREKRGDNLSL
ncbi:hypothetical protein [Treponema sp. OMZ 788]|uniref:hypothetical protein n=1 Tax=Treponema sp. OMZ 788 TaxID=2563664 RepID=UPI0020A55486|nr:hypothetical protein [Treponema sp. OMZ 788]